MCGISLKNVSNVLIKRRGVMVHSGKQQNIHFGQHQYLAIVNFGLTVPPTNRGKACAIVVVASFSETLIFRNDLGSQHSQLISAGNLQEILYPAYACNSKFSIQLSNHFNLIISSWEALYGIVGSNWWCLSQETLCRGKPQLALL